MTVSLFEILEYLNMIRLNWSVWSSRCLSVLFNHQDISILFQFPLTFNPMAQVSSDGSWHIPYETEFNPNPAHSFDAPSTWLCLQADKSSPTFDQVKTQEN